MTRASLLLFLAACGSSPTPEAKTPARPEPVTVARPLPPPNGTLRRADVREVMSAGLGTFLQRVNLDVEHPVFRDGQFVGFRLLELRGPGWTGIDLQPGDVVTAVNGFPVEHPEQAQQAFLSLAVASELRVDYERDGKPRSLRLAITDD